MAFNKLIAKIFLLVFILFFGTPPAFAELKLNHAEDLRVEIFAKASGARHMAFDDQGHLFLTQTRSGKVVVAPDENKDGKADKVVTVLKNRDAPHGLAFTKIGSDTYLYVAEQTQVIRLKRTAKPWTFGPPEVIVPDLPGGGHFTRTIKIKDKKLYLSVGSSCDVCIEDNPLRAAVFHFNLDGSGLVVFAEGLRNTVGMEFSPYTGELWGVNNGRDMLGDDHPREELNIIRMSEHYGWPYCYEDRVWDKDFGRKFDCSSTAAPARMFTAHMAPLGMEFYSKGNLPSRLNHSLFIAFHGSWNRSVPAGYKVVRVKLDAKGQIVSDEDFITGWLTASGGKEGRPVDLELSPSGDLFLSDDYRGVVYRITGK